MFQRHPWIPTSSQLCKPPSHASPDRRQDRTPRQLLCGAKVAPQDNRVSDIEVGAPPVKECRNLKPAFATSSASPIPVQSQFRNLHRIAHPTIRTISMTRKPIACLGDKHDCPIPGHNVDENVITTSAERSYVDGVLVARDGDETTCGAVIEITEEEHTCRVEGRLVAYLNCRTSHDGEIVTASETAKVGVTDS
ncbi:MAG: PAAR domain-containing protein [Gammaproteobacteria bacterium]